MLSDTRQRTRALGLRPARPPAPVDPDTQVIDLRDGPPIAELLQPVVTAMLRGTAPLRITFWDGSATGPDNAPGVLHVRSADALRRMVWAPGELGVARAYISGDLDVEGDV